MLMTTTCIPNQIVSQRYIGFLELVSLSCVLYFVWWIDWDHWSVDGWMEHSRQIANGRLKALPMMPPSSAKLSRQCGNPRVFHLSRNLKSRFFVFPYLWTSTCATNSPSLSRSLFQDECNHIRVFNSRGTAQRAVEKTCTHRKAGLTLSVYPFGFDILVCFPFFSENSKFKHKFIIESFDILESFVKFVFDSLVGTYWYQIHWFHWSILEAAAVPLAASLTREIQASVAWSSRPDSCSDSFNDSCFKETSEWNCSDSSYVSASVRLRHACEVWTQSLLQMQSWQCFVQRGCEALLSAFPTSPAF